MSARQPWIECYLCRGTGFVIGFGYRPATEPCFAPGCLDICAEHLDLDAQPCEDAECPPWAPEAVAS